MNEARSTPSELQKQWAIGRGDDAEKHKNPEIDASTRVLFRKKSYSTASDDDAVGWYWKKLGYVRLLEPNEVARLSDSVQRQKSWMEAREELDNDLGRPCTDQELADRLGLDGGATELRYQLAEMRADRDLLISSNLPLVVSIAKRYRNCGLPMDDLVQEGILGLIRAAEKFDPKRGNRLSTLATHWIRQGITRSIANHSRTIRLPVHMHEKVNRLRKARSELQLELGRWPRQEELAEHMDLTLQQLRDIESSAAVKTVSMETPLGHFKEKVSRLEELLSDRGRLSGAESCEQDMLHSDLSRLMKDVLTEREEYVMRERYGLSADGRSKSNKEIGNLLHVSQKTVCNLQCQAMKKMRSPEVAEQIADYPVIADDVVLRVPVEGAPAGVGAASSEQAREKTPAR